MCITTIDGRLRSKQFGQQQDVIAFLALTAQSQGFAVQLARGASTLPNVPFLTARTLVDRVRHPLSLALELLVDDG